MAERVEGGSESEGVAVERLLPALFRLHSSKGAGVLHLSCGVALTRLFIEGGEVVHVDGTERLWGERLENPTGRLDHDVGALVGAGVPANDAMKLACEAIGAFIVDAAYSGECAWGLQPGSGDPESRIPLPSPLGRSIIKSLSSHPSHQGRVSELERSMGRLINVVPEEGGKTATLPPLAMRFHRHLSRRSLTLQRAIEKVSSKGATPEVWRAIDTLLALGLIELGEEAPQRIPKAPAATPPELEREETTARSAMRGRSERHRMRRQERSRAKEERAEAALEEESPQTETKIWTVAALKKVHKEFSSSHPFQIFGLVVEEGDVEITPYDVRRAFRRVAAEFHPDRFTDATEPVREAAAEVFALLNNARSKIETTEDLQKTIRRLKPKKSGERVITELDRSKARAMARDAEIRIRRRNWGDAKELLEKAIELVPDDLLYQLRATFCRGVLQELPYDEAAREIEKLDIDGRAANAERLYRAGWLWKLHGNHKESMRCFQAVLKFDPDHTDVNRELRMVEKRQAAEVKSQKAADTKVPFARFFKKR